MRHAFRRARWILLAALPLFAGSCTTDFRDALYGGVLDFITGTTTELLANLIPIAQAAAEAQ